MKKTLLAIFTMVVITGCSSSPPLPPEPEGPLIKVNVNQPHETFGGNKK